MNNDRNLSLLAPALFLLLPAGVSAQSPSACVPIGAGGAFGCQSSTAPTLNNGIVATGDVVFDYDPATGILTVTVDNDSPVVAGETNPVITRIGFNFPAGAVSSAMLVSQSGSGGATPAFALQFSATQSLEMGCLGFFHAVIGINSIPGAIGNAAAPMFAHPQVVLGPVTFQIQLTGNGLASLTAETIATTPSQYGNPSVPVAVKFQGGGHNGSQSGWVSGGGVCCLEQAMLQSIGAGCAPAGLNIPTLTGSGLPVVGGPFGVDLSSPSTPFGVGLLVFGLSTTFDPVFNLPLPIDLGALGFPGCSLYVSSEFSVTIPLDGAGAGSASFNIPPLLKWCGREIAYQMFVLSSSNELLSSNGLVAMLGS